MPASPPFYYFQTCILATATTAVSVTAIIVISCQFVLYVICERGSRFRYSNATAYHPHPAAILKLPRFSGGKLNNVIALLKRVIENAVFSNVDPTIAPVDTAARCVNRPFDLSSRLNGDIWIAARRKSAVDDLLAVNYLNTAIDIRKKTANPSAYSMKQP